MAEPHTEEGRDIASRFNAESYDTVNQRAPIPFERSRQFGSATTRVTSIGRQGGGSPRRTGNKLLRTGATLSRTGAGAVVGVPMMAAGAAMRSQSVSGAARTSGRNLNKNKLNFQALRKARGIIKENRDLFNDGDETLIVNSPPEKPSFPIFFVGIAILKDFIDILDVSIIGIIITTIVSLIIGVVLFFWTFRRASGGWWKKKLFAWLWKRYVMVFILELIPFFKIVPATTIFILMAHYRELKMVKIANLILEEVYRGGYIKNVI